MTDTFNLSNGMGTGDAQVLKPFDNSKLLAMQLHNEEKKQRAGDTKQASAVAQLSKLQSADIHWKDRELFKKKGDDIRAYVTQNIDKLRAGDATAQMGFDQLMADAGTQIDQSKHFRDVSDRVLNDHAAHPNKYRPETIDYLVKMGDIETAGQWQLDPDQVKQNINIDEYLNKNVKPQVDSERENSKMQVPYQDPVTGDVSTIKTERYGEDKAREKIRSTFLNSPQLLEQVEYNLKNQIKNNPNDAALASYIKDDGTLDVGKYAEDTYHKRFVSDSKITSFKFAPSDNGKWSEKDINNGANAVTQEVISVTGEKGSTYAIGNTKRPIVAEQKLPANTINSKDNTIISDSKIYKVDASQYGVIPISKVTGVRASDDAVATLTAKGLNVKDYITYAPVMFGKAIYKAGGKPIDVIIPLDAMSDQLKANKFDPTGLRKVADKLNGVEEKTKVAKINATQQKAIDAFVAQLKREPTAAEREKILNKYK